jgi:hypothetical protein
LSFFDRWAKLKREADAAKTAAPAAGVGAAAEAAPAAAAVAAGAEPAMAPPAASAAVAVCVAGPDGDAAGVPPPGGGAAPALPALEDVVPGGDLKAFFGEHVPEALRQAAMRRMWAADPAIRDFVSEACDYAWDWNVPGGAPGCGPLDPSEIGDFAARLFGDPVAPQATPPGETAALAGAGTPDALRDQTPQGVDDTNEYAGEADAAVQQIAPADSAITRDVAEASEMERFSETTVLLPSRTWAEQAGPAGAAAPVLQARRHGGALPR